MARCRQRGGFTLLELILALALSVLVMSLLTGLVGLYSSNFTTRGEDIRRVALANKILNMIAEDLRSAVVKQEFDTSVMEQMLMGSGGGGAPGGGGSAGGGAGFGGSGQSGGGQGAGGQNGGGLTGSGPNAGQGLASGGQNGGTSGNGQSLGGGRAPTTSGVAVPTTGYTNTSATSGNNNSSRGGSGGASAGTSGGFGGGGGGGFGQSQGSGQSQRGGSAGGAFGASGSTSNSNSGSGGANGANSSGASTNADGSTSTSTALPLGVYGSANNMTVDISRLPRPDEYIAQQASLMSGNLSDVPGDIKSVSYYIQTASSMGVKDTLSQVTSTPTNGGMVGGLVRRAIDRAVMSNAEELGQTDQLNRTGELVAPEVLALSFSYYDGTQWMSTWDSSTQGLPWLVDITIAMQSKTGEKNGVVTPGISLTTLTAEDRTLRGVEVYTLTVAIPGAQLQTLPSTSTDASGTGGSSSNGMSSMGL